MKVLLEITWSEDGEHLTGTLRLGEADAAIPFTGILELVARIEELLDAESEEPGTSKQ
jgi:hypothetical protein